MLVLPLVNSSMIYKKSRLKISEFLVSPPFGNQRVCSFLSAIDVEQAPTPSLSYGLERVLFK